MDSKETRELEALLTHLEQEANFDTMLASLPGVEALEAMLQQSANETDLAAWLADLEQETAAFFLALGLPE